MTKHRKRTWGGQHANARHFRPKTFLMTDKQIEEMQAKLARYREIEARLLALDEVEAEERTPLDDITEGFNILNHIASDRLIDDLYGSRDDIVNEILEGLQNDNRFPND